MRLIKFIIFSTLVFGILSCTKEPCNDPEALNFNSENECVYSKLAFYAINSFYVDGNFTLYNVISIQVSVNGKNIGSVTKYIRPNDCSTSGTVPFTFKSGERINWVAKIKLDNGETLETSGSNVPSPSSSCLIQRVDYL